MKGEKWTGWREVTARYKWKSGAARGPHDALSRFGKRLFKLLWYLQPKEKKQEQYNRWFLGLLLNFYVSQGVKNRSQTRVQSNRYHQIARATQRAYWPMSLELFFLWRTTRSGSWVLTADDAGDSWRVPLVLATFWGMVEASYGAGAVAGVLFFFLVSLLLLRLAEEKWASAFSMASYVSWARAYSFAREWWYAMHFVFTTLMNWKNGMGQILDFFYGGHTYLFASFESLDNIFIRQSAGVFFRCDASRFFSDFIISRFSSHSFPDRNSSPKLAVYRVLFVFFDLFSPCLLDLQRIC